jgi:hypothetical protein
MCSHNMCIGSNISRFYVREIFHTNLPPVFSLDRRFRNIRSLSFQIIFTYARMPSTMQNILFIYSMENMQGNKKQDELIVPLSFPAESLL